MTSTQLLALLLALSVALVIALAAFGLARGSGKSVPQSVLIGGGAAATALTVFFTAVSAYH